MTKENKTEKQAETQHEARLRHAAESYAHHVIQRQSPESILLQRKDTINLWVTIAKNDRGGLIVTGDIDPVIFAYYSGPADLASRIAWMGSCTEPDCYFMEKARIGMMTDAALYAWDMDMFFDDVRELFEQIPREYGDPDDVKYKAIKAKLDFDEWKEDHECSEAIELLDHGHPESAHRDLYSYLENRGICAFERVTATLGRQLRGHIYLAHAALRRAHLLLNGDQSDD